jgi:hypothetical protein
MQAFAKILGWRITLPFTRAATAGLLIVAATPLRPGDGKRYAESARDTCFYSIGSLGGTVRNASFKLLA